MSRARVTWTQIGGYVVYYSSPTHFLPLCCFGDDAKRAQRFAYNFNNPE